MKSWPRKLFERRKISNGTEKVVGNNFKYKKVNYAFQEQRGLILYARLAGKA